MSESPLASAIPALEAADVLLCDADGNLFPSEEPAFVASTTVTNDFMAAFGRPERFTPEGLRLQTTGKNFRTTVVDLAVGSGIPIDPALAADLGLASTPSGAAGPALDRAALEDWVEREKVAVSAHLAEVLRPDPDVLAAITALAGRFRLAVVSSSALSRLDACFRATGLAELFPPQVRFSAEDSLPVPTSKPHPAIYQWAGRALGAEAGSAIAIEDSVPGAQSALSAGFATVGNVRFVPQAEREERAAVLRAAGVDAVVSSWPEIVDLLLPARAAG